MGLPVEVNPLFLENQYAIQRSLRFRYSAGANLTRTPSSNTSGTKCTFSVWIKLGSLQTSTNNGSFITDASNNVYAQYYNNTLYFGNASYYVSTAAVFRDFSSWYHVFFVVDSTLGTTNDRMQIWVNGVRQTVGTFNTQPGLSASVSFLNNTIQYQIGGRTSSGSNTYFDGYMGEVNFIDGQALAPTAFGQYNEFGVWSPRKYGGSYGTNGFYLPFTDTTSTTTLVADSSGNGNNWTPNNISTTPGTTYDAMTDVPTPSTIQNVAAGNYCVLNPLDKFSGNTPTNGNLFTNGLGVIRSTFGMSSGKWYWEVIIQAANSITGIATSAATINQYLGQNAFGWGYYGFNGYKYTNGGAAAYGATFTTGDIIGIAFDADIGSLTFYKNGASQGVAYTGLTSGPYFAACSDNGSVATPFAYNFGQQPFRGMYVSGSGSSFVGTGAPPSGFLPLNTNNLPSPTIPNGAKYMAATLYTGTGSTNQVFNSANNTLGVTFKPDFVWIRNRPDASGGMWLDSVRGTSVFLQTTNANGNATNTGDFVSFNNDGFTVGGNGNLANLSTKNFVGWNWNAGSGLTTPVPSGGTITPTAASVNISAGFSVIQYTGNGTAGATVGHGLGVAPSFVMSKVTSRNGDSWFCYHSALGGTKGLTLETTAAAATDVGFWFNTNPTNSVVTLGTYTTFTQTYILYAWAAVSGYSAFGIYTGNGLADGPFIYTGFRPRWVMIKATTNISGNWIVIDTSRLTYNQNGTALYPNSVNPEVTTVYIDTLSNGFKIRNNSTNLNNSGSDTYVYACFAENPFKMALSV